MNFKDSSLNYLGSKCRVLREGGEGLESALRVAYVEQLSLVGPM